MSKPTFHPTGHFHSPVVDPETVGDYHKRSVALEPEQIAGIEISIDAMISFWRRRSDVIKSSHLSAEKSPNARFHYGDSPFPFGDALFLRAIMADARPKRIIEIGSGFSTACMLDAADELGMRDLSITCIEPNPQRLKSVLRPETLLG